MKIDAFIQKSPVAGIMATQLKLSSFLEKKFGALGLNYLEALVLASLFFEDKSKAVGPSQIARSLLYPLPRVSAAISSLHEKGFLNRELQQNDSRRTVLVLTASGSKRASQVVGKFNDIEESIGKIMTVTYGTQLNKTLLKLRSDVFLSS